MDYNQNRKFLLLKRCDGSTEVWVWDGLALIRRGSDIYVNEPHVSGGVPILSKTDEGVRYHEHDFLGTTLWSTDTKGNLIKDYQDTTIFGEGSIQKDRSARFTGKPYDEDLQAYVFPTAITTPPPSAGAPQTLLVILTVLTSTSMQPCLLMHWIH